MQASLRRKSRRLSWRRYVQMGRMHGLPRGATSVWWFMLLFLPWWILMPRHRHWVWRGSELLCKWRRRFYVPLHPGLLQWHCLPKLPRSSCNHMKQKSTVPSLKLFSLLFCLKMRTCQDQTVQTRSLGMKPSRGVVSRQPPGGSPLTIWHMATKRKRHSLIQSQMSTPNRTQFFMPTTWACLV